MPRIFESQGYKFFFFSNEGNPREPIHVHVRKADGLAKVWLEPEVRIAEDHGFSSGALRTILELAVEHRDEIRRAWNDYSA